MNNCAIIHPVHLELETVGVNGRARGWASNDRIER